MSNSRSLSSSAADTVIAGTANRIMNPMAMYDHTRIGMRLTVIPGARILNEVTRKFTAPTVVEMPTKITPRPQKSRLMPGEKALSVSGT